jgi:N-acetylneuraminic acid mutarotase
LPLIDENSKYSVTFANHLGNDEVNYGLALNKEVEDISSVSTSENIDFEIRLGESKTSFLSQEDIDSWSLIIPENSEQTAQELNNPDSTSDSIPVKINSVPTVNIETSISIEQDTTKNISFTVFDSDNDEVSVSISQNSTDGIVEINSNSVKFTPNSGFYGNTSFKVLFDDGNGGKVEKTININVSKKESETSEPEPENDSLIAVLNIEKTEYLTTESILLDASESYDELGTADYIFYNGNTQLNCGDGYDSCIVSNLDAGTYTFKLEIINIENITKEDSKTITVVKPNESPVAKIKDMTTNYNSGDSVTFDGSESSDSDGTISSYLWSSNIDGNIGSGLNLTVSNLSIGTHTVTLTVTDNQNKTSTDTVLIVVSIPNLEPIAKFSVTTSGTFFDDTEITFDASQSSDDTEIVKYIWSSSLDGSLGFGEILQTQLSEGNHTITLTVQDGAGATATKTEIITVVKPNESPVAVLNIAKTEFLTTENIILDGSSSSDDSKITNFTFYNGDSLIYSGTESQFTVSNLTAGTYTFKLKVTDSENLTHEITKNTTVIFDDLKPQPKYWTTGENMPTARGYLTSSVIDGKIYVIGGYGDYCRLQNKVEIYNPETDSWTTGTNMPTERGLLTSSVVDGKIYVIGGFNYSTKNKVEIYNPETDSWTTGTNMPTSRSNLTSSVVDGKIYVIGGDNEDGRLNKVEIYNPETDSWTTGENMPTERRYLTSSVVDGKIYIIGGDNEDGYQNKVEIYNPETDSWTTGENMPTAREGLTSSAVDGKIYVIGGNNGHSGALQYKRNEVEIFNFNAFILNSENSQLQISATDNYKLDSYYFGTEQYPYDYDFIQFTQFEDETNSSVDITVDVNLSINEANTTYYGYIRDSAQNDYLETLTLFRDLDFQAFKFLNIEQNFTRDNTTQIVTDLVSGLKWEDTTHVKNTDLNYADATSYCENLTLGEITD